MTSVTRDVTGIVLGAFAALSMAAPVRAQDVTTAVVPQTIHVGDVFHAAVRVDLPPGAEAIFPDTLALASEDVEAAGRVRISTDTAGGVRRTTAAYPLTAWRSGEEVQLPEVTLVVRDGAAERVLRATFPAITLASVLPADTSGIEPKPAKDVVGGSRIWWPWLLAGVLALLLAAALWYLWWRRRSRGAPAVVAPEPAIPPRAQALALLRRAREERLVERGELKTFYALITAALRGYLAAVDPELGADLTTSELARHARRRGAPPALLELLQLLGSADLVKFAKVRPNAVDAYGDWDAARTWVEQYDGWVPSAQPERGRAA